VVDWRKEFKRNIILTFSNPHTTLDRKTPAYCNGLRLRGNLIRYRKCICPYLSNRQTSNTISPTDWRRWIGLLQNTSASRGDGLYLLWRWWWCGCGSLEWTLYHGRCHYLDCHHRNTDRCLARYSQSRKIGLTTRRTPPSAGLSRSWRFWC